MSLKLGLIALATMAGLTGTASHGAGEPTRTPIKHFIFFMQGGRTFDNYFGTYPGADGIPPGTCERFVIKVPNDGCVKPYLPHGSQPSPLVGGRTLIKGQYDHGKMDGFVAAYESEGRDGTPAMAYYNAQRLGYYWNVARQYVLFDHFFSTALYGTRANRCYWVAAAPPPGGAGQIRRDGYGNQLTIFDRLQATRISWKFYVQDYDPKQTYRTASLSNLNTQAVRVPLLNYPRFVNDPVLRAHIVSLSQYYRDLTSGSLPAVAFIASAAGSDERSARTISAGQNLMRNLITQLMVSRFWESSALMWSYDGSGGFYDHVAPPLADGQPLGLRVPALLVSPYARQGQVNHTVLDYTSVLAFIEQNWHLVPLTARDAKAVGLSSAFNFTARPRLADVIWPSSSSAGAGPPMLTKAAPTPIYVLYSGALAAAALLVLLAATRHAVTGRRLYRSGRQVARTADAEPGR